ncbi:MAG TPA: sugar ABC transporter permease, partial [Paracoccaceae bacterium]|nr:sugar ABC transporter permease [Paracoccaceae bacterium]
MPAISELKRARVRSAWLFLTPMVVALALVAGWPLVRTIFFSFTDANLTSIADFSFIGLENYYAIYDGETFGLLADPDWWNAVWNTVFFTVVSVTLETVLGLIVALAL